MSESERLVITINEIDNGFVSTVLTMKDVVKAAKSLPNPVHVEQYYRIRMHDKRKVAALTDYVPKELMYKEIVFESKEFMFEDGSYKAWVLLGTGMIVTDLVKVL